MFKDENNIETLRTGSRFHQINQVCNQSCLTVLCLPLTDAAESFRKMKPGRFPLLLANMEVTFILDHFSVDIASTQMFHRIIARMKKYFESGYILLLQETCWVGKMK